MDAPPGDKPGTYQGLVEIVIGETGRVAQVAIRKSIHPAFDAEVIASTGYWRFQPATKDGKPVKFRRAYEIIGHSRDPIGGRHALTRPAAWRREDLIRQVREVT